MFTSVSSPEVQSDELVFDYLGRHLEQPLATLVSMLEKQHKEAMARIAALDPLDETDPYAIKELVRIDKKGFGNELRRHVATLANELYEAQLWRAECQRTPDRVWRLKMPQLKWIYRWKAPEGGVRWSVVS